MSQRIDETFQSPALSHQLCEPWASKFLNTLLTRGFFQKLTPVADNLLRKVNIEMSPVNNILVTKDVFIGLWSIMWLIALDLIFLV